MVRRLLGVALAVRADFRLAVSRTQTAEAQRTRRSAEGIWNDEWGLGFRFWVLGLGGWGLGNFGMMSEGG